MGKLGVWLGHPRNASTYMAGILSVLLLLCMVLILFVPVGQGIDRGDALKLFGSFFLGTIGYLFGSLRSD